MIDLCMLVNVEPLFLKRKTNTFCNNSIILNETSSSEKCYVNGALLQNFDLHNTIRSVLWIFQLRKADSFMLKTGTIMSKTDIMSSGKLTSRSLVPDMDQHVKRMLKLIEEDADSFTKKVEIYYQKRPELINLVEDVYRMYRSLAERYDHVTGELRKNIPSDLQSQCSGITDLGSEPPSTMPSPSPSRRQSGHRAPGFEYFLGNQGGDESSALESESESDDSSVNCYSGVQSTEEEQGLRRKIIELDPVELREVREKRRMHEEVINCESPYRNSVFENNFDKFSKYEQQLRVAKEKIHQSEEEIRRLNFELRKYKSLGDADYLHPPHHPQPVASDPIDRNQATEAHDSSNNTSGGGEGLESERKILTLWEEHRLTREKLRQSEQEIARLKQELTSKGFPLQNLQDQLKMVQKELSECNNKLEEEREEAARYKADLAERDQEIMRLKEAISRDESLSEENDKLRAEISRLSKERCRLEENLRELELRCLYMEEETKRVEGGKAETEAAFGFEIEQLKAEIGYKNGDIEELKISLEELQAKHDVLVNEKDDLNMTIFELGRELTSKDDRIDQMSSHLHQMQVEQVDLIAGAEAVRKVVDELQWKIKELEREVEKKEQMIVQGAEEKREAIRQLCFSLEHYRNGYHRLREVVTGPKVVAT